MIDGIVLLLMFTGSFALGHTACWIRYARCGVSFSTNGWLVIDRTKTGGVNKVFIVPTPGDKIGATE